jgi:uncharacterized protein YceK
MRMIRARLPLGLIACVICSGCATVTLHPISTRDIQHVAAGETLTAPQAGWFLSDFYVNEVMKARVR